jgi:hypothetical protein
MRKDLRLLLEIVYFSLVGIPVAGLLIVLVYVTFSVRDIIKKIIK